MTSKHKFPLQNVVNRNATFWTSVN